MPHPYAEFENSIHTLWEQRDQIPEKMRPLGRKTVAEVMALMGEGKLRVAEKENGAWVVHEWLKKAVLLSFRLNDNAVISGGPGGAVWFDKVASRLSGMDGAAFGAAGFRAVPGCFVRESAYIAPRVVLMPSFINAGAYVGEGTMIDSMVTVGSCAQVGKNCHISANVCLGGVLEPLQAAPVIIEDNVFVGAGASVTEGMVLEEGCVLGAGVHLGGSTKIVDRETGEAFTGRVPAYAVVVSGALPGRPINDGPPGPHLYCAVIVKRADEKTRSRTSVNDLLRT